MGCVLGETFNKMKPYLAMISLQFGYAGMHIVLLLSFKRGFSHWVFVVYRHAVATVFFAPFAYYFEKKIRPKMTKSIFFKIMLLGFLEPVLDQNLYGVGIQYTSATFAAATVNILPAVTFIMAVVFRLEKVNLKKVHSLAKVIGTTVTVIGAMLITLYKGPAINILFFSHGGHHEAASTAADQHWVTGTIMLLGCINNTLKEYPAELSLTTLICLMGTVEGGIVAAIMERRPSAWAIGFDARLLAATYSGLVCSGIAYYLQSVVNKAKGPVFVTSFSPLSMIITAFFVVGAVIIVSGLYCVVWGKTKEDSAAKDIKSQQLPVVIDMSASDNNINGTTLKMKINSLHEEP
ncbi:hypothetical protein SASPL_116314 [Salvia splendens]|uniref:WAT1-related protein n=1 Tax=Salvia splendens TaxID=180675 RepID=A0A8X8ZWM4_SALSN|nr:hypothetical protein SASPL_116314 [Salvia splendens]